MEDRFLRQRDLINQKVLGTKSLTVVGCGSIGSFSALTLAKMGISKITLYDFDNVETHNLSNQFFRNQDLGLNKAEATAQILKDMTETQNINVMPFKYEQQPILTDIILAVVDNIEGRQNIFMNALKSDKCKLYLDVRMNAGNLTVLAVDLTKDEQINSFVNDFLLDVNPIEGRCTARTIIYTVLMCCSHVADIVKKYVTGNIYPNYLHFCFDNYYRIVDMKEG